MCEEALFDGPEVEVQGRQMMGQADKLPHYAGHPTPHSHHAQPVRPNQKKET